MRFRKLGAFSAWLLLGVVLAFSQEFRGRIQGVVSDATGAITAGATLTPLIAGNKLGYTPPMDAVTEYTVQQNSVDAEFGHSAGGIVLMTMRSGTNTPHGTAYFFGRKMPAGTPSRIARATGTATPPTGMPAARWECHHQEQVVCLRGVRQDREHPGQQRHQCSDLHAAERAGAPGRLLEVGYRRRGAPRHLRSHHDNPPGFHVRADAIPEQRDSAQPAGQGFTENHGRPLGPQQPGGRTRPG